MEKKITNDLFNRQEISFIIEAEKNPSFADMRKLISEKYSCPEEAIDVYNIKGKFGRNTFLIKANIYDSKENLAKAVQKTRKQIKEDRKLLNEKIKADFEAKKKEKEAAIAPVAA